jgi:regulator of RNase E activity RraA
MSGPFAEVPTSDIGDILRRLGIARCAMTGPVALGERVQICGPARTLKFLPDREDQPKSDLGRRLFDSVRPGEIVVIDAMGWPAASVLGEMLAHRLRLVGAGGIVIDGAVRDAQALRATSVPVYARSISPASYMGVLRPAEIDVPVQCGGVLVCPGDIIRADEDGIVAIPASLQEQVGEAARSRKQDELFSAALLDAGFTLLEAYPLPDSARPFAEEFARTGRIPAGLRRAMGKSGE